MQKVTWASTSVPMPKRSPAAENSAMNATARMISGIITGSTVTVSIRPPSRNFLRTMPTAPSVPSTTDALTLISARIRLVFRDSTRPRVS